MERQRPFRREGFTEEEADAIVRRAVELQQQAGPGGRIRPQELEESAEAAGVAPEFVQQAISELRAQEATTGQAAVPRRAVGSRLAIILAGLIAFGISMLLAYRLSQAPDTAQRGATVKVHEVRPVEVAPAPPALPARPAPPAPPTHR